jgi:hypothetical protein
MISPLGHLKSAVRELLPSSVLAAYRRYKAALLDRRERRMSTEEVFTRIYVHNRWAGPGLFFSGSGSHEGAIVAPYVAAVTGELQRLRAETLTAVDLGCGDFSIGRQLAAACRRYVGVDIVRPLIEHNRATFGSERIAFHHANIIEDEIPAGDICFVRQVLQHLSNAQIRAVLPKLARYRWCFITEHHPSPGRLRRANLDKPQGADIRVYRGSGVFLELPPFNVPKERYRLLLEVPGQMPQNIDPGVIRTFVLEHPPGGSKRFD